MVRTTIRCVATPSRTRLPSLCARNSSRSASASASTSATSPSRRTPGGSAAPAARSTVDRAADADLRGRDEARLDVEADDGLAGGA